MGNSSIWRAERSYQSFTLFWLPPFWALVEWAISLTALKYCWVALRTTVGEGSPPGAVGGTALAMSVGAAFAVAGGSYDWESRGAPAKLRNRRTVASLIRPDRVITLLSTVAP